MGGLKKMRMVAYSDEKFTSKVAGGEFVVMLNPEQVRINRSVSYNEEQAPGSGKLSSKYRATLGEQLSFEMVLDCTGVVDSTRTDLTKEMNQLKKVVYDYNGNIHRPNYVVIYWGQGLSFKGVLQGFDTTYTFFRPDGTALRARVSLQFTSYLDPATAAKQEDKKSPDLTHRVDVVDGDSLPQISQMIYRDPECYVQLAAFNQLDKIRSLPAGLQLRVPPLKRGGDA
ncbi:hypothetical protein [Dickeya fangzhongdai]|uniref:CIS tube protein n=1 Tax=Dickeya fangzhongdai TaxID=1778540 RepID=UPI001AD9F8DF|nr:hypothetical protein [Dickeya fangzhongdai]MBO8134897.1 hypothetical protein [Dickeya fangzhongdai]